MRIRRKKHLGERLEQVKKVLIVPPRDLVNVKEAVLDKKYFDYNEIFKNDNPVCLEIGCGKGGFICQTALNNPDKNYIAVELLENIIVMASEKAINEKIENLVFVNSGAEYLPRYIKNGSIDSIFLNFSPPYPQDSYENRRLTSDRFMLSYKDFLRDGGQVFQKTDDKGLFDYSKSKFIEHGFDVKDISEDLKNGTIANVKTEYEEKFLKLNLPIYGLIATKKN